jgi:hypothetical protein
MMLLIRWLKHKNSPMITQSIEVWYKIKRAGTGFAPFPRRKFHIIYRNACKGATMECGRVGLELTLRNGQLKIRDWNRHIQMIG